IGSGDGRGTSAPHAQKKSEAGAEAEQRDERKVADGPAEEVVVPAFDLSPEGASTLLKSCEACSVERSVETGGVAGVCRDDFDPAAAVLRFAYGELRGGMSGNKLPDLRRSDFVVPFAG